MSFPSRHWLSLLAFLAVVISPAGAQGQAPSAPRKLPRPTQVCSMLASVVSIRLVDAAGKPIRGGTVQVTRLRDSKPLGQALEMVPESGEFEIVESSAISWITPDGDRFGLVARAKGKSAKTIVRIGRDPSGCRLVKLTGPDALRLK